MLQNAKFPVKEVPAYWESTNKNKGNGTSVREMSTGYKFIVREDTNKVLSCMTNSYKLVRNDDIIKTANPLIKKMGGEISKVNVLKEGSKTVMNWTFPNNKIRMSKDDELIPEINIVNSYDGSLGLNILGGAFRIICSNGLVIGFVASKYTNKHIKTNIELNDLDRIIEETIGNTSNIFKDEFPILAETKFKEKHLIEFIKLFPEYANTLVTNKLIIENPKTFWDLLNVGTNILTHHMNREMVSTHNLAGRLYPKVKKLALKEADVAIS